MNRLTLLALCLGLGLRQVAAEPPGAARVGVTPQGRVSLEVEDVTLEALLETLASRLGLAIYVRGPLETRVTLTLRRAPLEVALRAMLREESYVLQWREVWHGPLADSPNRLYILREHGQAGSELRLVAAPDPEVDEDALERIDTLLDLAARDTGYVVAELARLSLAATDEAIAEEAVHALAELGTEDAVHALTVALWHPLPRIREEAVYALDGLGRRAALERAQQTGDEIVRTAAREALERPAHGDRGNDR